MVIHSLVSSKCLLYMNVCMYVLDSGSCFRAFACFCLISELELWFCSLAAEVEGWSFRTSTAVCFASERISLLVVHVFRSRLLVRFCFFLHVRTWVDDLLIDQLITAFVDWLIDWSIDGLETNPSIDVAEFRKARTRSRFSHLPSFLLESEAVLSDLHLIRSDEFRWGGVSYACLLALVELYW